MYASLGYYNYCMCCFSNRKKQKNNVVFIHLNLCIALALALLVFVAGIETAKDSKVHNSAVQPIIG